MSQSKDSSVCKNAGICAVKIASEIVANLGLPTNLSKIYSVPPFDESRDLGDYDSHEFANVLPFPKCHLGYIKMMVLERVKRLGVGSSVIIDLGKMVAVRFERGVDIDQILRSSNPMLLRELIVLQHKYSLKSNADNSINDITLSRVSMAFPEITCLYMENWTHPLVSRRKMNSISPGYPSYMMTNEFASLIPKNEVYTPILKYAFLLHTIELSMVINRKMFNNIEEKKKEIIDELERSLEKLVNMDFLPDDFRRDVLKKWKLVNEVNGLTVVNNAVRAAAKVWLTRYKQTSG